MKQTSGKLNAAMAKKDDEFYTPPKMIKDELAHYDPRLFKGKRILCNCDDPGIDPKDLRVSEFFRYFDDRFEELELKQLVGIRYSGSVLFDGVKGAAAYTRKIAANGNGKKRHTPKRQLRGDTGGFEDYEGKRQLADCDIVVTNPPFSRFREFISLLMEKKKKFVVIGNINAIGYKEIFPLIRRGDMWLGTGRCKGKFVRPDCEPSASAAACWFTNLPHNRREREFVPLTAKYRVKSYPRYDNYPAIEVGRVADIPADYDGEMGVPITFLEKHNPRQFEIIGRDRDIETPKKPLQHRFMLRGKEQYARLVIKRLSGALADWIETKDLDRRAHTDAAGFVYVATTDDSGWYKIGMTHKSVNSRVKRDTFIRKAPKVVMALLVHNAQQAENDVHKALDKYREKGTEFFNPSRAQLEKVLSRLAKKKIRLWE